MQFQWFRVRQDWGTSIRNRIFHVQSTGFSGPVPRTALRGHWRRETGFEWTIGDIFSGQSQRLNQAAEKFLLPESPFDEAARRVALVGARHDVAEIFAASEMELQQIVPPNEVVFP